MKCGRCGLRNPPGMRFCGGCGTPLQPSPERAAPAPAEPHLAPHRRHMTVMFCDIVGSTPLAEMLDPEDFRDILSSYQHACVRAIERFSGYTARYAGDGLVVYFGYPHAHEDSTHRAIHAGLGILEELVALNGELRTVYGITLQVRIGIHSGVVVVGEMGAGGQRDEHAIVGETPHVAARLESMAAPGTILISEETRQLVEGAFETESLGEQILKGVSRPMLVHRVLGPADALDPLEVVAGRRLTPLVGRDAEMPQLIEAWEEVDRGRGAVVHVAGQAGIGKSRLLVELGRRLEPRLGAQQFWYCSPHHRTTPLYPVIRYLERLAGPGAGPVAQREALSAAVRSAGLDPQEAVPLLADLLSLRGAGTTGPALAPRDVRASTLRILETLILGAEAHHPLLLVVEDVHWADPTTIELLSRLVAKLPTLRVMCVVTYRNGFEPPWAETEPVTRIELGPLESEHVRALATWASPKAVDPAVLEWVDAAADGIPLFVEETLRMLEQRATAGLGPDVAIGVPSTLQGLLTERLDRLPELSDLIDMAAVLGREFDLALLEELWPGGRPALEPALVQLAAHEVLRPVQGAVSRCEFTHALLQEAAYARILRRQRQALHGRVADSLLRTATTVAEREPEIVAHHWSSAAQPEKAAHYWRIAGMRALERAAFREASHHFRRGLEALDAIAPDPGDDLERAELQTHMAAALQAAHGYGADGVEEAYAAARRACRLRGARTPLVAIIRGEWMYRLLRAEYGAALELGAEMLERGREDGDARLVGEGHLYRGLAHMYVAHFDEARVQLQQAYDSYTPPDHADQVYEAQGDTGVGALAYLALVLWNLGFAEDSQERSDLSLRLADAAGGPVTRAQAWGMRSILHLTRGEPDELALWVGRTRAHSVNFDIGYWSTVARLLAGWQTGRGGDLEAGIATLEEQLAAYERSGSRLSLPHFLILLADLRAAAGDRAAALDALHRGEEHIAATGERFSESELHRFRGRVLMSGPSPDPDGASAAYRAAIAAAHAQNAHLLELRAASHLLVHQRRTGETPDALDRVADLCAWFGSDAELADVARARRLLAAEAATT